MLIITFTRKLLFLSPLCVRKLSANNAQKTLYLLVSSQLLSGEGIETSVLLQLALFPEDDLEEEEPWAQQARQGPRQVCALH